MDNKKKHPWCFLNIESFFDIGIKDNLAKNLDSSVVALQIMDATNYGSEWECRYICAVKKEDGFIEKDELDLSRQQKNNKFLGIVSVIPPCTLLSFVFFARAKILKNA